MGWYVDSFFALFNNSIKMLKKNLHWVSRLKSAFSGFKNPGELFLAINAEDSSIVYYKLSMGITKPPL